MHLAVECSITPKLCCNNIVTMYHFCGKTDILISEEDSPPQASKPSTGRSLIKVDLFSVTLHEGADELAFTLIK